MFFVLWIFYGIVLSYLTSRVPAVVAGRQTASGAAAPRAGNAMSSGHWHRLVQGLLLEERKPGERESQTNPGSGDSHRWTHGSWSGRPLP
jgi:hypothetical protein